MINNLASNFLPNHVGKYNRLRQPSSPNIKLTAGSPFLTSLITGTNMNTNPTSKVQPSNQNPQSSMHEPTTEDKAKKDHLSNPVKTLLNIGANNFHRDIHSEKGINESHGSTTQVQDRRKTANWDTNLNLINEGSVNNNNNQSQK